MNTTTELEMTTVKVLKSLMDWAISSQASWEQDEGSTTRLRSPDRTVKTHECGNFEFFVIRLNNHKYHPREEHMIYYYVYRITNKLNNKIYVGCHQTLDLEDGYMGSGKYLNQAFQKYGFENFTKEILEFYPDQRSMFAAEAKIVTREFIESDNNYNLAEGGHGGFKGKDCYESVNRSKKISACSKNKIMAKDSNGVVYKINNDDPRFETKELVGVTKGKATVKDKDGNILKVDVNDPRLNSGELVGNTKGLAVMKDSFGNRFQVHTDDPRIKTGELVGNTKGYTQSEESNKKRSETLKGIKRVPTYASCVFCKKTTSLTNIIRWHLNCSDSK